MTRIFTLALPKGRILEEVLPILSRADIRPEDDFFNKSSRKLTFDTNRPELKIVRVRSFDVPAFVSSGAAHIGVTGFDVLEEFGHNNLYAPVDLKIGLCRLSVAVPANAVHDAGAGHISIATKYPNITKRFYAARGIQAECIKLNGAMELAPLAGISDRIVDLVSTGKTLKENGLIEAEKIMDVSSRLILNRVAYKLNADYMRTLLRTIEHACTVSI